MSFLRSFAASLFSLVLAAPLACGGAEPKDDAPEEQEVVTMSNKAKAVAFLKSIETGDEAPFAFVGAYKQHNLDLPDGPQGLLATLAQLPKGSARVKTVRAFQDGDFVFTHTDYDFFGPKIGFDVFRFEDGKIAEHWDNLQTTPSAPNPSGRTMIDGPTDGAGRREDNKELVQGFVEDVLLGGKMDRIGRYVDGDKYIQHNPAIGDGITALGAALKSLAEQGKAIRYERVHRVLGDGSFVLVMSEGTFGEQKTAYFDLFRVAYGKIAEHWDVIQAIPPRDAWKNPNGKF
jgi:predicted SnoaL-like aldol condensation-catalyzing enzyme